MNEKESLVLKMLQQNPFLSQQQMADELKMSRPALANIISNLTKQGYIVGRAYILSSHQDVICIGGANVDRKYKLKDDVQLETSNPSTSTTTIGGVARNIAENLGRLDHSVHLLSAGGKDGDWEQIVKHSQMYMNLTAVKLHEDFSTGSYAAVLNPDGELVLAMADMEIYDTLTVDYMTEQDRLLSQARLVIMDLNCPRSTVDYVKNRLLSSETELAIVPVSGPKMKHLPDDLHGVDWLFCNTEEAHVYTRIDIVDNDTWKQAVEKILEKGVKRVIVTGGSDGVIVGQQGSIITHYPAHYVPTIEDVTGAGDAFVSAVLHGYLEGFSMDHCVQFGLVNAAKTLQSSYTVRPELTAHQLIQETEELK